MAAQALRRYVSTPPDNLAWQFRSICNGGPGDMVGMCQRPAPQKMLRCRGGSHFFDHDLVGFGALPFFWAADRAKTSRGGIPSLRICLGISTRQLHFFWT